jgi:hypothetical protein
MPVAVSDSILTIHEWLATTPFYGSRSAEDYFQCVLTGRQLGVLERAALRGFLFDPEPERNDFRGNYGMHYRCWPEKFHDEEFRKGSWSTENVGTPDHFPVWDEYCCRVLDRPSVIAGRFFPEHLGRDRPLISRTPPAPQNIFRGTLGVRVHDHHACQDYRPARRGWGQLVRMAADAAAGSFPLASWIFFDGRTLAVLVTAAEAEALAAMLHDRMVDDLGVPEPDFKRS